MISSKLQELVLLAKQMEALLPGTPSYRVMYAALELDLDIALKNVAEQLITKFNIPRANVMQLDLQEESDDPSD